MNPQKLIDCLKDKHVDVCPYHYSKYIANGQVYEQVSEQVYWKCHVLIHVCIQVLWDMTCVVQVCVQVSL